MNSTMKFAVRCASLSRAKSTANAGSDETMLAVLSKIMGIHP